MAVVRADFYRPDIYRQIPLIGHTRIVLGESVRIWARCLILPGTSIFVFDGVRGWARSRARRSIGHGVSL